MRIRTKLLSAFGAVALLAMAVHLYGVGTNHHLYSEFSDLLDRRVPAISGISLMRAYCSRINEEAQAVIVARYLEAVSSDIPSTDPSAEGPSGSQARPSARVDGNTTHTSILSGHEQRQLLEEHERAAALMAHIRQMGTSQETRVICDEVNRVMDSTFRKAVEVASAPMASSAKELLRQIEELEDQQVEAQAVLDAASAAAANDLRQLRDRVRRTALSARFLDLTGIGLVGALSLGFGYVIARRAERPLAELVKGAGLLALGRHGVRVPVSGSDELSTVAESFNAMARALEESTVSKQRLEEAVQALAAARSEALAATQAKTAFLANMSHEIRTPLNAMLGFTALLRADKGDTSTNEREEWLDIVQSSAQHLLALVNDLLDISKIDAGKLDLELVRCCAPDILAEIVSIYRPRAQEKGVELELRYAGALPATIRTDPTRLRQAVMNLISNAVKFTTYGRVEVMAGLIERNGRPLFCMQVLDSGPGIAPVDLERIFDPFVQADASITRRFGGTGLGLPISRRIAEALGGTLTVQSELGVGSCFTLEVDAGPIQEVPLIEAPVQESLLRAASRGEGCRFHRLSGSILVVDDGEANSTLISVILRRAGIEVLTAGNGQVAVDLASKRRFDLILMDMQMPVMDGYTATRQLRAKGYDLPIIALTANAMRGDEAKCLAAGCSGYLTKPIEAHQLLETVAQVLHVSGTEASPVTSCAPRPSTDVVGQLHSTLPVDDTEFAGIVVEFVDRARERVEEMAQLLERGERAELARLAHWLKGAGGTAGFAAFTVPAARLEDAAAHAAEQELNVLLAELQDIANRLAKPGADSESKLVQLDGMGI